MFFCETEGCVYRPIESKKPDKTICSRLSFFEINQSLLLKRSQCFFYIPDVFLHFFSHQRDKDITFCIFRLLRRVRYFYQTHWALISAKILLL
jgi:hypothetical protein